ncbi:MAG: glycosyltransferase family 2 protein [Lachnospiraceae bacterium]
MMKLVSIVIPIYNVEIYLDQCIQSVVHQTYEHLEIILVDDGSSDNCGAMCDVYEKEDNRIKVIHKENGGLADARNVGVSNATGDYLLFVDSDDYIDLRLIEQTVTVAESTGADMVFFDFTMVDINTKKREDYTSEVRKNQVLSLQTAPNLIHVSTSAVLKLYRYSFWNQADIQFPVGRYYEDLGTIPKLILLAKKIVYLEAKPLYYYIQRPGSIMHQKTYERNYQDRTAVIDDILAYYQAHGAYERYKDELEYLLIENAYYLPCREVILSDCKNPVLEQYRSHALEKFPQLVRNPYLKTRPLKERFLFWLLWHRHYRSMLLLSYGRRLRDILRKIK